MENLTGINVNSEINLIQQNQACPSADSSLIKVLIIESILLIGNYGKNYKNSLKYVR